MKKTKIWWTYILIILTQVYSVADAKQVLKAVPEKIDLGTINPGEVKESVVTLINTGSDRMLVDKIKTICGCLKATISTKEILPGKKTELKLLTMKRIGGEFSYGVIILPKDRKRFEPLRIAISGNVVQFVSAKIGWIGKIPKALNPKGPTNLDVVHKLSARPIIYITAENEHFNLRNSLADVNSPNFELQEHKFEETHLKNQVQTSDRIRERLILTLKPKKVLKTGILEDLIVIRFANDMRLYVPIVCRIVGDVYGEQRIIHVGNLSDNVSKQFTIYFINNVNVWPDLKWDIKGYLSHAIVIKEDKSECTNSRIKLTLSVDHSKLSHLPKGYLFCRIKFYQNDSTDDVVSVFVDGFN